MSNYAAQNLGFFSPRTQGGPTNAPSYQPTGMGYGNGGRGNYGVGPNVYGGGLNPAAQYNGGPHARAGYGGMPGQPPAANPYGSGVPSGYGDPSMGPMPSPYGSPMNQAPAGGYGMASPMNQMPTSQGMNQMPASYNPYMQNGPTPGRGVY